MNRIIFLFLSSSFHLIFVAELTVKIILKVYYHHECMHYFEDHLTISDIPTQKWLFCCVLRVLFGRDFSKH